MRAHLLSGLGVVAALLGCTPGGGECMCFLCEPSGAVTLTVLDARTQGPLTTFVVDGTVNGVPLGQPSPCRAENREGNACTFGDEGGLYHLVVGAPGYETREVLVRQADGGAGDLCCDQPVCLASARVTVSLDPLAAP